MKKSIIASYTIGFILSLILTLGLYGLVILHLGTHHTTPSDQVIGAVLPLLAITQVVVQMIYFLHVGQESRPYLNLILFFSTVFIILLIVLASLWIMGHLNYSMQPKEIQLYMQDEEGIHK